MFRELFNNPVLIKRAPAPAQGLQPPGAPAQDQDASATTEIQREGAFITVQSLVSFPGATAAVTVLVNVAAWALPAWRGERLLFVIAAALVGLTIYLINEDNPLKLPASRKQRLVGMIIAAFNSLVILSAAVGADAMFRSDNTNNPTVQSQEVNHG